MRKKEQRKSVATISIKKKNNEVQVRGCFYDGDDHEQFLDDHERFIAGRKVRNFVQNDIG
jgi:hypothetical protein